MVKNYKIYFHGQGIVTHTYILAWQFSWIYIASLGNGMWTVVSQMHGCKIHFNVRIVICDQICEKGSYSLSNWMYLTVHCVTFEYDTNLTFGHLTLLTWFYSWFLREIFCINGLNILWVVSTQLKLEIKKGYKTLFHRYGHIC